MQKKSELDNLISLFSKLPGLGPRSARRTVLHLLKNRETLMHPLADAIMKTSEVITECERCGNLDTVSPCHICTDAKRDTSLICVVEEVADLWAFDRGGIYNGQYHVLGGVLSALDGVGPAELNIHGLAERVREQNVQEVIIATNATVDGQTTAYYIMEMLKETGVQVTRLAHGIPIGGELDYMDDGTLHAALQARKAV